MDDDDEFWQQWYDLGFAAARAGEPRSANPGTCREAVDAWECGHYDACEDL